MNSLLFSAFLFFLLKLSATAQPTGELFHAQDVLEIAFAADLSTLLDDVGEERDQHSAMITYRIGDAAVTVPLKARTRGNFRRNPENCNFPPLRLNFAKDTSDETLFESLDKVKLVTHCQNDSPEYEQYVVQEYLLYRVYNQLTDASFRARLLRINYVDTAGRLEPITRLGFLIEDEELMAARHEAQVYDPEDIDQLKVIYEQVTLLNLFEYMIGNIDWSVPIHHNMKLMGPSPDAPLIPVPYDFDHAGVIDAEYADEAPRIGTASLRYQLFREFCRSEKELQPYFELFNERRDAIYALYEHLPELGNEERRRALRFYDRFYRVINDEAEVEKTFLRPCNE